MRAIPTAVGRRGNLTELSCWSVAKHLRVVGKSLFFRLAIIFCFFFAYPVDIFPVTDSNNPYNEFIIVYRVNNAVVALAYPVFVLPGQFFVAVRSGITLEI